MTSQPELKFTRSYRKRVYYKMQVTLDVFLSLFKVLCQQLLILMVCQEISELYVFRKSILSKI